MLVRAGGGGRIVALLAGGGGGEAHFSAGGGGASALPSGPLSALPARSTSGAEIAYASLG